MSFQTFDGFDLIKNGLAFRAMYKKDGEYVSPHNPDFVWGSEGISFATCTRTSSFQGGGRLVNNPGQSWHPAEEIPHDDCTCGLYAAFQLGEATVYEDNADQAVLFLVEAHGKTTYYDNCMIAAEQRVIAAVGTEYRFSDNVACDYFKVPFVMLTFAKAVMDIQNYRVSLRDGWVYDPQYASLTTCKNAAGMLPPLELPIEDPSLAQAVEWPFK